MRDDSIDPLRAIYTEIIQPLVGDIFDIDAVLSSDEILYDEQIHETDSLYAHGKTKPFHRHGRGRARSKG